MHQDQNHDRTYFSSLQPPGVDAPPDAGEKIDEEQLMASLAESLGDGVTCQALWGQPVNPNLMIDSVICVVAYALCVASHRSVRT